MAGRRLTTFSLEISVNILIEEVRQSGRDGGVVGGGCRKGGNRARGWQKTDQRKGEADQLLLGSVSSGRNGSGGNVSDVGGSSEVIANGQEFCLLGPVVVSILQEAMNGCSSLVTEISPGLLLKDAAYGAAAYVYYELSNYLTFKDWFNGALSLEISNDHPNMRIIRRKVALILGQWVSEVLS
uniref:ARM repeat superfamily protein n=1 Tax=Cucumis sativus TaxID=3659 RepID=A0A0A0L7M2_CUCSA